MNKIFAHPTWCGTTVISYQSRSDEWKKCICDWSFENDFSLFKTPFWLHLWEKICNIIFVWNQQHGSGTYLWRLARHHKGADELRSLFFKIYSRFLVSSRRHFRNRNIEIETREFKLISSVFSKKKVTANF